MTQQALLVQGREEKIRSRVIELESQIGSLRVSLLFPASQQKTEEIQSALESMTNELAAKRAELSTTSEQFASVIGAPPAQPLPAPQPLPIPAIELPHRSAPKSTPTTSSTRQRKKRKTMEDLPDERNVSAPTLPYSDADMVCFVHGIAMIHGEVNMSACSLRPPFCDFEPLYVDFQTSRVIPESNRISRRESLVNRTDSNWSRTSFISTKNLKLSDSQTFSFASWYTSSCSTMITSFTRLSTTSDITLTIDQPICLTDNSLLSSSHSTFALSKKSYSVLRLIRFVLYIFLLSVILPVVLALPTQSQSQVSILALNANGLVSPVKLAIIGPLIAKIAPHFFAISETKTRSNAGSKLPISNYEIFEENGVPCSAHRGKWGIVLGVRKDIQVISRINLTHDTFRGRVVVTDVVIPCSDSSSFSHRIFAVYAPCDPGLDELSRDFWPHLTDLVRLTKTSWSLFGDLNATVSSAERASDNLLARRHLLNFLNLTSGTDLWQNTPDCNRFINWTSRAWHSQDGGNIIDRVITSSQNLTDFEIHTDHTWIPGSDHRSIIAKLVLSAKVGNIRHTPSVGPSSAFSPLPPPRIKYPSKADKNKFKLFSDHVDRLVDMDADSFNREIIDDDSYVFRYLKLTNVIEQAAVKIFGRTKVFSRSDKKITSPAIREIVSKIRHIGGAISILKGTNMNASYGSRRAYESLSHQYSLLPARSEPSLLKYLINIRKSYYSDLYAARKSEIWDRAKRQDLGKISGVLSGGSSKKLLGGSSKFISLPTALVSPQDPDVLVTDPGGVAELIRNYFLNLYERSPPPDKPKPWLSTPSVIRVRDKVKEDPFVWPVMATLPDFRAMLRKGNPRPSPGPDGWEKWCVKNLSDRVLQLVLDLHNYSVMNARFPGNLKDAHLTYFHKRGIRTNLSNWRGLIISNFLANSPMTWLNYRLSPYAARLGIIPDTQVATQPGVQTRDLMSFLACLKTWSKRNKKTVFLLKRDQMKGFDYLSPCGFYDACEAYGLPSSICDLDRAAQSAVKCLPRTAFGITSPIIVDGVTKQGGPISPFKSTITTSLGHRYLDDIAALDPDAVIIKSMSYSNGDPHLPDDHHTLILSMTEATDDSYLVALSHGSLRRFTLEMERFQFAYGWLTSWEKTTAHILNPSNQLPPTLSFPSITNEPGVDPWTVSEHEIPVSADEFNFLRTQVDDPKSRYLELLNLIDSFVFPSFVTRTPFTLIRKILAQNLISKCRALLSLQPVLHADAVKLDQHLTRRVHDILGFPFCPSSNLLTLPLDLGGFEFPSIARINAGITVDGLLRDLNHHISAYRIMAKITLADWTCYINNCIYPLDGRGLERNFSRFLGSIPSAWLIAHEHLANLRLALRQTDVSFLREGNCSISHVVAAAKSVPHVDNALTGHAIRSIRSMGFTKLRDLGFWSVDTNQSTLFIVRDIPEGRWSEAQRRNWTIVKEALAHTHIGTLYTGQFDLLYTKDHRRVIAENYLRALISNSTLDSIDAVHDSNQWGTDGSMIPASASLFDHKSVTAAVTGDKTVCLKLSGRNISILHGELIGLVTGIIMSREKSIDARIHTDHLNSVRLIDDSHTTTNMESKIRHMNARSYYRWILSALHGSLTVIKYTKGHANDDTIPSILNTAADRHAVNAHTNLNTPYAPTPTFFMDDYTPYNSTDGWIESNIRHYVERKLAINIAGELEFSAGLRLQRLIYDCGSPPEFPYLRAISCYSAVTQLYARAGQLPTAARLHSRDKLPVPFCRFGCKLEYEDDYHIFVVCPRFSDFRRQFSEEVSRTTDNRCKELMEKGSISNATANKLMLVAKSLFIDHSLVWPLHNTKFYLGRIPKVLDLFLQRNTRSEPNIETRRLVQFFASLWHTSAIRLAGRIWGQVQRYVANEVDSGLHT